MTGLSQHRIHLVCRNSPLSVVQAEIVKKALATVGPEDTVTLEPMESEGDQISVPLRYHGGKALFTRRIDHRVLCNNGCGDDASNWRLGVHSLKDMENQLEPALVLAGVLPCLTSTDAVVMKSQVEDPDFLVARLSSAQHGNSPYYTESTTFPRRVGTTSLRRSALLKRFYPAAEVVELRGNLHTRFKKLIRGEIEMLILATAGLRRLKDAGLFPPELIWRELPISVWPPAPGQGVIAITCPTDNYVLQKIVARITDLPTLQSVNIERSFLSAAGLDCFAPLALHSTCVGDRLHLQSTLFHPAGHTLQTADFTIPLPLHGDALSLEQQKIISDAASSFRDKAFSLPKT